MNYSIGRKIYTFKPLKAISAKIVIEVSPATVVRCRLEGNFPGKITR